MPPQVPQIIPQEEQHVSREVHERRVDELTRTMEELRLQKTEMQNELQRQLTHHEQEKLHLEEKRRLLQEERKVLKEERRAFKEERKVLKEEIKLLKEKRKLLKEEQRKCHKEHKDIQKKKNLPTPSSHVSQSTLMENVSQTIPQSDKSIDNLRINQSKISEEVSMLVETHNAFSEEEVPDLFSNESEGQKELTLAEIDQHCKYTFSCIYEQMLRNSAIHAISYQFKHKYKTFLEKIDTLYFVNLLDEKSQYEPQIKYYFAYHIISYFKQDVIDISKVKREISQLFSGHPDLILAFNKFLPSGHEINLLNISLGLPQKSSAPKDVATDSAQAQVVKEFQNKPSSSNNVSNYYGWVPRPTGQIRTVPQIMECVSRYNMR